MARTFKLIDLVALVGTVTAILGIYVSLSFLFLPETFGATRPDTVVKGSTDLQVSMRWIQPILGQAIVEDTVVKQQYESWVGNATKAPDRQIVMAHHPKRLNMRTQSSIEVERLKVDHAGRVQWVTGRIIVELTRHRMQAGVSTADWLTNDGNQRIITIAQQAGEQLNDVFKAEWQVRLGQAIVTETRNQVRATQHAPEEVGLIF